MTIKNATKIPSYPMISDILCLLSHKPRRLAELDSDSAGFCTICIHIIVKSDIRVNIQNRAEIYILLPLFHFNTSLSMFRHISAATRHIRFGYFSLTFRNIPHISYILNMVKSFRIQIDWFIPSKCMISLYFVAVRRFPHGNSFPPQESS